MASLEHVDVGTMRIGYRRTGSGVPVLLAHGAVSDGRVWRRVVDRLGGSYDVLAWDAPGCGGSTDPPTGWTMADFAGALAGFISAVGLDRPHLVGHSWGSSLAIEFGRQYPAVARSLVLVGAYAGWGGSLPAEEVQRRLDFAEQVAASLPGGWEPRSMPGLFSAEMTAEQAEELETIMSQIRPAGTRAMAHALAEDLRPALPALAVPTLLVNGDHDLRSPLDVAEALAAAIPDSTLAVLEGTGHYCFVEDPDAFEGALRAFLAAHS